MIICAFTDTHTDKRVFQQVKKKAKKADLVICLGDISVFGSGLENMGLLLKQLDKKVLIVHGNHELEEEMMLITNKTVLNMHNIIYKHKGVTFMGHGGGGFTRRTPDFVKLKKTIPKTMHIDILMTHQPPYGTKLDNLQHFGHVGNKDYTEFIKKHQPVLALSGHLHENFKKTDKIGKTLIANPGPTGELFEIKDGKAKKL